MKNYIENFPHQLQDALDMSGAVEMKKPDRDINNIWLAGMGGSGIGANIVQMLTQSGLTIPMTATKGYTAPGFVDGNTLFIACSYSGNTEETLSCLRSGLAKGAQTICVTSGGEMTKIAQENTLPIVPMPPGSSSPRAMLGYSITAQLYALHHIGLISGSFIEETRRIITLLNKKEVALQKQAAQVSRKLNEKLPWLYGAEMVEPLLIRFQNQLNENAKHLAHINVFPELNHNEIEGWNHPKTLLPLLQPVYLHVTPTHKRVRQRMQLCRELFERASNPVIDLFAEGDSLLEQYYFLIHLTDWISFFLARENNVDPEPVNTIMRLKKAMQSAS